MESRKDPPTSEAQRRAMGAAMSGNSNLDIPKSVGEEFIEADPGGKLPARTKGDRRADQIAAIQDGLSGLVRRMDALEVACGDDCRDDAWSEEARKAAAEARRHNAHGGEKAHHEVLSSAGWRRHAVTTNAHTRGSSGGKGAFKANQYAHPDRPGEYIHTEIHEPILRHETGPWSHERLPKGAGHLEEVQHGRNHQDLKKHLRA